MTRITLRAKSDGTEINAELVNETEKWWDILLASDTSEVYLRKNEWDRIYELPKTPGTVFRATVRGVENVRVATVNDRDLPYFSLAGEPYNRWHSAENIDASTVRIELEGDES